MSRSTRTCRSRPSREGGAAGHMSPHDQPPDVDRLARSMLMLHGDHDSHDEPAPAANGRRGGSWSKAPAFADDPERAAAVAGGYSGRPHPLSDIGPAADRLPVLPRDGERQAAGAGTHCGAMEYRSIAALRLFRRATRDRGAQRADSILPEIGRQHRTRGCRRVSGSGIHRPARRRRLSITARRSAP